MHTRSKLVSTIFLVLCLVVFVQQCGGNNNKSGSIGDDFTILDHAAVPELLALEGPLELHDDLRGNDNDHDNFVYEKNDTDYKWMSDQGIMHFISAVKTNPALQRQTYLNQSVAPFHNCNNFA